MSELYFLPCFQCIGVMVIHFLQHSAEQHPTHRTCLFLMTKLYQNNGSFLKTRKIRAVVNLGNDCRKYTFKITKTNQRRLCWK